MMTHNSNLSVFFNILLRNICFIIINNIIIHFTVPSELPVLRKESFNNWYKLRTYYTAFLVANIPVQVSV